MAKASIISTGKYLPKRIVTNRDLEKIVDTNDEWIVTRTGIRERRIAAEDESTSDLAAKAIAAALEKAGIKAEELDMIIVATFTPDAYLASTACVVQRTLGAKNAGAVDIAAACTGFVYGLSMASAYIQSGMAKYVAVVGAELITRFLDWQDRSTCVLFGDGAGAAIVGPGNGRHELVDFVLCADGTGWELLSIPAGGSRKPPSRETVDNKEHYLKMAGREIFKFAVSKLEVLLQETARLCDMDVKDIECIVPHQVNNRIFQSCIERLGLRWEQFFINLDKYGNTSAASIPIALEEAVEQGFVKDGSLVTTPGLGAGLTYGTAIIRW